MCETGLRYLDPGHARAMDHDEACFMHLSLGLIHNLPQPRVCRIAVPRDPSFPFKESIGPLNKSGIGLTITLKLKVYFHNRIDCNDH